MTPLRIKTLKPVLGRVSPADATDADALRRFARDRDGDAFELLVRRYAPLVNGVCRRVLGARPEADDAVQATFWTLTRKAGSIRDARTLPAWLHAVAYRTDRKAAARVDAPPARLPVSVAPDDPLAHASWREVRRLLDAEVHRLPSALKLPILLCYYEDLTRDEAATRLGWSLSTVQRRLNQARHRLKVRLVRRGVGPGLLGGATLLAEPLAARETRNPRERVVLSGLAADRDRDYRIRVRYRAGRFTADDRIRVLVAASRDGKTPDPKTGNLLDAIRFPDASGGGEIYPPADHPLVITVGDAGAESSVGPTMDHRVKPDVVLRHSEALFTDGEQTAGESNAAAYFTGVVALLKAAEPGLEVRHLLELARQARPATTTVRRASTTPSATPLRDYIVQRRLWRTPTRQELSNAVRTSPTKSPTGVP